MANCIENTTDYSSYSSGTVDGNSPRGLVTNTKYNITVDFGNSDWNYKEVNTHISTALDPLFKETGKKFDIDWRLLAAWCFKESGFNSKARNTEKEGNTAAGIWQFTDETWNTNVPDGLKENAPNYSKRFIPKNSMQAFESLLKKEFNQFKNAASRKDKIAFAIQAHHDGINKPKGTSWANATFGDKTYLKEILNKYHGYCR